MPATAGSNLITMCMEIPAEVLPHSRVNDLAFPPDPEFSWNIELPSCRSLVKVLDGMKQLGAEETEIQVRNDSGGLNQEMLQSSNLQTCEIALVADIKSGLGVVQSKISKRPLHSITTSTGTQTTMSSEKAFSSFKVKQLSAAFEVGLHVPSDFILGRLVPKTCLYLWYPLLQMENCHVCVCVASIASKRLDAVEEEENEEPQKTD
eukprot:GHVP01000616.1.p1 GENE.GHVP01000616.1~~GHVP01000616.1.p1  ORF type:complete len:206 (+),score=42.52 GHVP01000616.1:292-909(+)